jgi:hypothetical protein
MMLENKDIDGQWFCAKAGLSTIMANTWIYIKTIFIICAISIISIDCHGKREIAPKNEIKTAIPENPVLMKRIIDCSMLDSMSIGLLFPLPNSVFSRIQQNTIKEGQSAGRRRFLVNVDTIKKYCQTQPESTILVISSSGIYDTAHFDHFELIEGEEEYFSAVYSLKNVAMQKYSAGEFFALSTSFQDNLIQNALNTKIDSASMLDTVIKLLDTLNCHKAICLATSIIGNNQYTMGTISLQKRGQIDSAEYFNPDSLVHNYRFAFINGRLADFEKYPDSIKVIIISCISFPIQIVGHPLFCTCMAPPMSDGMGDFNCWSIKNKKLCNVGWDYLRTDSLTME